MSVFKANVAALIAVSLFAACTDAPPRVKGTAEPDVGVSKADELTRHYVEQVSVFGLGDSNKHSIGYPTWFQGHLIDLDAGKTIGFLVTAQDDSLVRLYGPAIGETAQGYEFAQSVVRDSMTFNGAIYESEFTVEVEENGVYMLVVGPLTVWDTEYKFRADEKIVQCTNDSDCSDAQWCGCAQASCQTRECRAFAVEGEVCGGLVAPHQYARCAPGLECLGKGVAYDLPGVCAPVVSVSDIKANPAAYDGRLVVTQGHIEAPYAICTQQACNFENACCNSCGGQQLLFPSESLEGEGLLLSQFGEFFQCGGNNCNWSDNCTTNTGSYWLGGRVGIDDWGQSQLEVDDFVFLD